MQRLDAGMRAYYRDRAPVYDRIYAYPERQDDLRFMERHIPEQLAGLDVLEIAAGTGYWSQFIASSAKSLLATDANSETLDELTNRQLSKPIEIRVADAYSLQDIPQKFNAVFSGLWISHIPKQRIEEFLLSLHRCLHSSATVLFMDNSPAQKVRLPMLPGVDEYGNTYQQRELDNGSTHKVLKNFPSESELVSMTSAFGCEQRHIQLEHFWLFQYTAK